MKNKKYLTLYHYSAKNIFGKLSPKYYGENFYTGLSVKLSPIKKLYFYTEPNPEPLLSSCQYCYIAKIQEDKIYNVIEDKLCLNKGDYTFNEIIEKVKNLKYKGIFGSVNGKYNVVYLFENIKAKKQVKKSLDVAI
jgi:hypothetical protein